MTKNFLDVSNWLPKPYNVKPKYDPKILKTFHFQIVTIELKRFNYNKLEMLSSNSINSF